MSVLLLRVLGTAADDEAEYAVFLGPGEQGVAGLAAEGLEVGDRGTVGGEHAEALAGGHGAERAIGTQHRDRTGGAFHVEEGFAHWHILRPGARVGQARKVGASPRTPPSGSASWNSAEGVALRTRFVRL